MNNLFIGRTANGNGMNLSAALLTKHTVVLGASGSGKTVLSKAICEEAVRSGIPVLAIDTQGDLASLALPADQRTMEQAGTPSQFAEDYWSKLDIQFWTPGSTRGQQLSMQPCLNLAMYEHEEDRLNAIQGMAYELGAFADMADDQTLAGLASIIEYADDNDMAIESIDDVCAFLKDPPDMLAQQLEVIFSEKDRRKVLKNISIKLKGPRRLLLEGAPIDIDAMLGYADAGFGDGGAVDQGKTRVSVICLSHLGEDERQLVVAALMNAVYAWGVQAPSAAPKAMVFIDECANFVPAVRKPIAKASIMQLLRKGRKYGICMLLATQSPGDIDYVAAAQASTKLIGRMATKQEAEKIGPMLNNVEGGEALLDQLPSLKTGQFIMVSPDQLAQPQLFKARWLVTEHKTLSAEQLEALVERNNDRASA